MIEVVIPAYNAGPFLRETLHSVAAQTLRPALVTVVDDASTDDTVAVAEASARELVDRVTIQVLRNTGPRGPSAARNTAIRQSSADHIALLDADDLLLPHHHALLSAALGARPDTVLSFGDNTIFNAERTLVPSLLAVSGVAHAPAVAVRPGVFSLGEAMFTELLRTGVFGTSACLFKRELALAVGLFDETMMFGEDTDFFLRLALVGGFTFTRAVVADKRVHGQNLTHERNRLSFCRGTVHSLVKLARGAGRHPPLSGAQRAALRARLAKAVDGHLYTASRAGYGAYWTAARMARAAGFPLLAAKPRHIARLALRPLL